jgi:hypothetical protein
MRVSHHAAPDGIPRSGRGGEKDGEVIAAAWLEVTHKSG